MTIAEPTDQLLWAQARQGSKAAFGQIFDRHGKAVYNHCFRLTASWTAAEDTLQTTFLTAWRKRDRVQVLPHDSLLPWLLSVATNVVRDDRRSARRWFHALARAAPDRDSVDLAEDAAERIDAEHQMKAVLRAVRRLPRGEREALVLCVWSAVPYSDAAAQLGITEGAVRARVSRARARLARSVEPAVEIQAGQGTTSGGRS